MALVVLVLKGDERQSKAQGELATLLTLSQSDSIRVLEETQERDQRRRAWD